MLTISKPLAAGQAQTYHAKEFTSAEQNYWKQGDTIVGQWQGRLAASFGLMGDVDALHFARLSEGQHPLTGEQLVRYRPVQEYARENGTTVAPVEHRAGWDATFSAPKSVSLTALVGGDDRVREAHRAAVSIALTELERYTQARSGGNTEAETTNKFVAATFEHDTARPVDGYAAPQLHTHAVIFNMTEKEDGSVRALQPRGFFDSQQFATAVYQAELTYRLCDLGYEIHAGRSGAPEIKGYTREYLDASSPRWQQIKEHLERTGYAGPEAAQIAAHSTRDRKEVHSADEVRAAHNRLASEHGGQAANVVAEARSKVANQEVQRPASSVRLAQEAVTYAKERGFEREAVSDERLLMRDALRRGMGTLIYSQVRNNFEQRFAKGEFQTVDHIKHTTGRQFTTPETIAMEKQAIASVQIGQNSVAPIMSIEAAEAHAATRSHLKEGQRAAIREVLTSEDCVHGFQGLAGAGKTTTLEAIKEGAERNGYAVEGFAPTSKAANQLKEAGIPADTLQGFLARGGREQTAGDPASRHLYMLDESSLASTWQMRDFLDKIGPQDRVLVIGDTRQHQGVDAGKPFEQMQAAGMQTTRLEQIVRQKDPELLRAVEHLSKNETIEGIRLLQQQGRVTEIPDAQTRFATISKDFAASPEGTIIVCPDNKSRRDINQAVRLELQSLRLVDVESYTLPTLIPRSDMTGADRQWAAKYQVGEVLLYRKGSADHGIEKGSYARVIAVDVEKNRLTVRRDDGKETTYDPKRLQGISAYQEIHREFAKGDRIQFTAPSRALCVANRDLGTIEGIHDRHLTIRLEGSQQTVTLDSRQMKHLDHGYAVTSHSSQGLTARRVLINIDTKVHPQLINTRFAYVAVSRASQDARIYTNDAETLGFKLGRDVSKSSAERSSATLDHTARNHPRGKEQSASEGIGL